MRKASFVGAVAIMASLLLATPALAAASTTENIENFPVGTPLDATGTGWTYTGGSSYDVGIVSGGIDGKSVRISNATMSGSFGDWLFSPAIDEATENNNQEFTATFDIKSASGVYQPGLQASVAPQTAGGARMSFVKFTDTPGGIVVSFADVMNLSETIIDDSLDVGEDWRQVNIDTLSYTEKHTVQIVMNLIPGPHNDVVQVYIDDPARLNPLVPGRSGNVTFDGFYAPVDHPDTVNKAKMGQTVPLKFKASAPSFATSWEDYYRYNKESNGGQPNPALWTTRQVDSLIFQARCAPDDNDPLTSCANENLGPTVDDTDGYLIDNVTYATSDNLGLPVAAAPVTDPAVFGAQPFTSTKLNCNDLDGPGDVIETYAVNALGLKYTGDGIWHYNWQTKQPGNTVGSCVEMSLTIQPDLDALFTFTK